VIKTPLLPYDFDSLIKEMSKKHQLSSDAVTLVLTNVLKSRGWHR
jgi:reverse gyrase